VVSVERQTSSAAHTSDTGRYQVAFLFPGRYVLTVEAPGFKKHVREDILLAVAEKLGLDLKLEVGVVTESVTVRARPEQVRKAFDELNVALPAGG